MDHLDDTLFSVAQRRLAPEPSEGAFLTAKELAEWLGVSQQTIRAWCERGRLPHVKIEGNYRFLPDEIEAWLQARYRPAAEE